MDPSSPITSFSAHLNDPYPRIGGAISFSEMLVVAEQRLQPSAPRWSVGLFEYCEKHHHVGVVVGVAVNGDEAADAMLGGERSVVALQLAVLGTRQMRIRRPA